MELFEQKKIETLVELAFSDCIRATELESVNLQHSRASSEIEFKFPSMGGFFVNIPCRNSTCWARKTILFQQCIVEIAAEFAAFEIVYLYFVK